MIFLLISLSTWKGCCGTISNSVRVMAGFVSALAATSFLVRVGNESKRCSSSSQGKVVFGRLRASTRACISSNATETDGITTLTDGKTKVTSNQATPSEPVLEDEYSTIAAENSFDNDEETEDVEYADSIEYTVAEDQDYVSVKRIDKSPDDINGPSYSSIVDVNITTGGVLGIDDEDNNELFTGVGFDALLEDEQLVENLEREFSITTTTHVQLAAIPRIMEGEDVVIQGHTGTGKTLAFLLPLLEAMDPENPAIQAMIIAPTRELAMQISGECARLCKDTGIVSMALIGGANPVRQVEKLRKRAPHVIIGTPGRIAELEESRAIKLRELELIVIDEVDQCIENPFRESIENIFSRCPRRRQLIVASATGDVSSVRQFASLHMRSPVLLRVGDKQLLPKNISNWYVVVPPRLRIETIRKLMFAEPAPTKAICFVDDPRRTAIVLERLHKYKIAAGGLRGNADKTERAEVIKAFRLGRLNLLVTTEIAARGLDVRDVSHVFNLDLPTDSDHYVHRAGRCGRVGREGVVVNIATPDNAFVINRLQKQLNIQITRMEPRRGQYALPVDRSRPSVRKSKAVQQKSEEHVVSENSAHESPPKLKDGTEAVAVSKPKKEKEVAQPNAKVRKKKRSNKLRNNNARKLPSHITSKVGITKFAKQYGWVGNRDSLS